MPGDETLIRAAKKILSKEVTSTGVKDSGNGGKMFGVPTIVIIALLGGGGASYGGFQVLGEGTSNEALHLAGENRKGIAVLEVEVKNLSDGQRALVNRVETARIETREDIKTLGRQLVEEIRAMRREHP